MQTQLVQTEKMTSLGNLVAGVAHEINNPVNFIHGNLFHVQGYVDDLLAAMQAYQDYMPEDKRPDELVQLLEDLDVDFIMEDCPKSLKSMNVGTERIREIVSALRNFSRIDESTLKEVDIHDGLESTLLILHNRLKERPDRPGIEVIKNYGDLPLVECYPGHLNQVFMNILVNAIDALEERDRSKNGNGTPNRKSQIFLQTEPVDRDRVRIKIGDNGPGIEESKQAHIFDPFFTTKAVGKGTGLGMSISRQIVCDRHGGTIACHSAVGEGTEFVIEIPQHQRNM